MAEASPEVVAHRKRRSSHRTRRRKEKSGSLTSSHHSLRQRTDVLDVEEIRRVRADYYSKSPEERRNLSAQMSRDEEPRRRSSVSSRPREESTSTSLGYRTRAHVRHHHRHRRPKEETDEGGGGYVYGGRGGGDRMTSTPSLRSSRTLVEERRPSVVPDRLRVLRTLGLDAGSQYTEYREIRKPQRAATIRRRSYAEEEKVVRAGSVRRASSDNITLASTSRPRVTRSVSMRETSLRPSTRPTLGRSQSSAQRVRRISRVEQPLPTLHEESAVVTTPPKKVERSVGILGSIFASSRPAGPEKKIECLTCMSDDVPISKSAKLSCGHCMCHACLRRIFTMSVTDPAHMPPRCCTQDHIPLKHVDKLFDVKFKTKWNKKYQEYTTKNRLYCPARGCGEWIKPGNIYIDTSGGLNGGRKYGKCGRCRTKVCVTCNGRWHTSRECPKDEATTRFAEIAKEAGWQRCYNCSAMVELKEGCNHMTCRCRAEFCMICGVKWKGCDCPWFNYQAVENDRLNHMNIAQARRDGGRGMEMPRAYHEELERRREQERIDEVMARRLQGINLADRNYPGGVFELGNGAGHFLHEHFMQRATNILAGNFGGRTQANAANNLLAEVDATRPRPVDVPPAPPPPAPAYRPPPPPPRRFNSMSHTRPLERPAPRRVSSDRSSEVDEPGTLPARALAGLTRSTTMGRVNEWRRHVDDDGSVAVL